MRKRNGWLSSLKKKISQYKVLTIIAYIVHNYSEYIKLHYFFHSANNSARAKNTFDKKKELEKANIEFSLYQRFASFKNKRVLELGVGAYFLNPFYCLVKGAREFIGLDLWNCVREPENTILLQSASENLSLKEKEQCKRGFDFKKNKFLPQYFSYVNKDISDYVPKEKLDYIISYATFEHIYDIKKVASSCYSLLDKGGAVIAVVDNEDHGMFDKKRFSVYEYYTIKESCYKHMVALSGRPNRFTPLQYKKWFSDAGFDSVDIFAYKDVLHNPLSFKKYEDLQIVDFPTIERLLREKKKKFAKKYRVMSDEAFIASYFILVARKEKATLTHEAII